MTKTLVITQSNYLPWRGMFDLFRRADEVILLDSVQYTRRDWRNRNIIKSSAGPAWITIPVEVSGRYLQAIDETRVVGSDWVDAHRRAIERAYRGAACFDAEAPFLFDLLGQVADEPMLSVINDVTLRALCARLAITTPIRHCVDLIDRQALKGMRPTERLIALCLASGATDYLSGPTARNYLDVAALEDAGIRVHWMSYDGYKVYQQLGSTFEPRVSVVDLMLNLGGKSGYFIEPD